MQQHAGNFMVHKCSKCELSNLITFWDIKSLGISTCYTVTIYTIIMNYTLCTVTLVSELTDSLRQIKPVFLLSSAFPKTHKCTFTTFYFTCSYSSSNSIQFDISFVRVIFQTHKVMCSQIIHDDILCVSRLTIFTVSKPERQMAKDTDA